MGTWLVSTTSILGLGKIKNESREKDRSSDFNSSNKFFVFHNNNFSDMGIKKNRGREYAYYQVLDCYDLPEHERFYEVLGRKDISKVFAELRKALNEAEYFRYLELHDVLLQYEGWFDKDESFVYEYGFASEEELQETINQKVNVDGKECFLTNINGIFVGETTANSDIKLEDNIYSGENINVLLGYNYMKYYKIGDEITVLYLGESLKVKIKGFLKENTVLAMGDGSLILDSYIIMPGFEIPQGKKINDSFTNIHLSYRTKGFLKTKKGADEEKALREFEKIIQEKDLDYVCIPLED